MVIGPGMLLKMTLWLLLRYENKSIMGMVHLLVRLQKRESMCRRISFFALTPPSGVLQKLTRY